jgi:hypothetical protein
VHDTKAYGGVDLYGIWGSGLTHTFVNLSLHVCDLLASGYGLFYPCGKIFRYPLKKRFGGFQGGMVAVGGKRVKLTVRFTVQCHV